MEYWLNSMIAIECTDIIVLYKRKEANIWHNHKKSRIKLAKQLTKEEKYENR